MHSSSSLNGALATEREQALRAKARDGATRRAARLPRRLRRTAPTE
jgi:hypothetical protein